MSAFADPEIIKMAAEEFVPVCADDWYQRRRQDAEGEFFRKVANQGPKKGQGGNTRQGIYVLTADGELLSYKNAGQDATETRKELQRALVKFDRLPASRRRPGGVTVPPHGRLDPDYTRTPPPGGLIARVHARILDVKDGELCKGTCATAGGDMAARDFLWLTADEVKAMAPSKAEPGSAYPVPRSVADRILLFHLLDNSRGEPHPWSAADVRHATLTLAVTGAMADAVELELNGAALLATNADPAKAGRGYDVRLRGKLRYRPDRQSFDKFEVAALGEHWGETVENGGARPGRSLLGVAFGLAGDTPADRVPPQGARDENRYFGRD